MMLRRAGFTLIELLVVIAIIGILMAAVRPSINAANDRESVTECEGHLAQVQLALREYVEDHGRMPASLDELVRGRYLLDDEVLYCAKTHSRYAYHPVSPDAPDQPVIVSCVPPTTPQGKRPHGQGDAYVYLRLNGKVGVERGSRVESRE